MAHIHTIETQHLTLYVNTSKRITYQPTTPTPPHITRWTPGHYDPCTLSRQLTDIEVGIENTAASNDSDTPHVKMLNIYYSLLRNFLTAEVFLDQIQL
jgi:hypothetical protein